MNKNLILWALILFVLTPFIIFAQDSMPSEDSKVQPKQDDVPTLEQLWNDYQNSAEVLPANYGAMVKYHAQLLEHADDLTDMQKEKINECGLYLARAIRLAGKIDDAFMDEENRDKPEARKYLSHLIGKLQIQCMMVRNLLIELDKELPYPQDTFDRWDKQVADEDFTDEAPEVKPEDNDKEENK